MAYGQHPADELEIRTLHRQLDELQKRLDDQLDLVEWLKHALSEQAWHFRATVEALQLQYRHDTKRRVVFDAQSTETPIQHAEHTPGQGLWGHGQRS